MNGVTQCGNEVYTVYVVFDFFIGAQLIGTLHQRLTDNDVTKGDDVSNYRGRYGQHKHLGIRETKGKWQVVPHLREGWRGNTKAHIRHLVFTNSNTGKNSDQHAWHHAVIDYFTSNGQTVGKAAKGHREHQVQTHQTTDH